jgi:hypothetical protein
MIRARFVTTGRGLLTPLRSPTRTFVWNFLNLGKVPSPCAGTCLELAHERQGGRGVL